MDRRFSAMAALQQFVSMFHGRCAPYLHDPETQADALSAITRHINVVQKSPTDALAVRERRRSRYSGCSIVARTFHD
jgi:hypothetical protein